MSSSKWWDRVRARLRKIYPWYALLDPPKEYAPPEQATPDVESPGVPPRPPAQGDDFVSLSGEIVPREYINSSSDDYLFKRHSDNGEYSVILLPAKFLGAVTNAEAGGDSLRDSTRRTVILNGDGSVREKGYPNGARVHLKAGKVLSGAGRVTCCVNGEEWRSDRTLNMNSERLGDWRIVPVEGREVVPDPTPPTPGENPVSVPPDPSTTRISYDGHNRVVISSVLNNVRTVLYDGSLGVSPQVFKNAAANRFAFDLGEVRSGAVKIQLHQYGDDYRFELGFPIGFPWAGDVRVVYVKEGAVWPAALYSQGAFGTRPEWTGTDSSGCFRKWVRK